ncbi:MAG: SNF2-related protein, partial [Gammaproteobacteria bacterium]|nr:SNF2-related protein [Gammaproteobacteria bacterium]
MIYKTGQKWISGSEPELGMGSVTSFDERLITIDFELSEETRTYARQQAPLTRVRFSIGDRIRTRENHEVEVKSVSEKNHLLIYEGDCQGITISVAETELHPDVRFSKPQDRLLSHQLDENRWFDLRYFSLLNKARLSESDARGLYGPRVSLIGHQLFIASQVATRFVPRVLLADEVGLGKTIEAGLIIHKQLQTGKASRILIIVPPALCFQWFVELVRRFNLAFVILDEDRCTQIENDNQVLDDPDQITEVFNPFDAQQLMLCEMGLFLNNPLRLEQALESDIDLLVIDEAHHLEWTAEAPGIAYQAAELLSTHIPGLLLLTATPEQLGKEGHYARLRLLDPARFPSLGAFIEEEKSYEPVAQAANKLVAGDYTRLSDIESLLGVKHGVYNADQLLDMLLDRHGTGRILFRNVRSAISGFPDRKVNPYPLVTPSEYTQ